MKHKLAVQKMALQKFMEDKVILEHVFNVKQLVDQMDLVEFKTQWNQRSQGYAGLDSTERLKYMVMSIKILQAEVDLKRMISSIKELSPHEKAETAIHYFLRTNLWKFLDNFRYILLIDEIHDTDKLECLDILDQVKDIIAQDENLKESCVIRLHPLLEQLQLLKESEFSPSAEEPSIPHIYDQLERRLTKLLYALEPQAKQERQPAAEEKLSPDIQRIIEKYSSFSVTRISIERSGVLSIIRLLSNHPLEELEAHRTRLQETLTSLEQQVMYHPNLNLLRNTCAYALIVLLEIIKMHKGLPVLLSKILELCAYIEIPPPDIDLEKELRELKGRVTQISQQKLRPIIEDVLLKEPLYLANVPHIKTLHPWCFLKDQPDVLNISDIRRVVQASFDQIEAAPGIPVKDSGMKKSRLSEMVIETLGLLVNVEPSPRFLKSYVEEAEMLKDAKDTPITSSDERKKAFDRQFTTFKNHLTFLEDSLEYYDGILEDQ